ncbi:HAD-IIA family hydrolase [Cohnella fermenti]|uniref:HAD-IIA family hydrolase n=1 Tax=Cohnella fermenti TaxID=2565925 RepID=A0A4S4BZT3_9BACL|nr:HAD-IIA family hydrolase [Cohnella fermenti]THF80790.1 HAD-IIA family hydrolase [Cohnella fermenti]
MYAVILAAGIGSRLRPLTYEAPKCMTEVYGVSILERQVQAFERIGIQDIIIITGYRSTDIESLNLPIRYNQVNFTFIENSDYESTNNMYSLYLGRSKVDGSPFYLCNGDVFFDPQIVQEMNQDPALSLVAVDSQNYFEESMKVTVNQSGVITDISKGIKKESAFACSIDLYKFSAESSSILFKELRHLIETEQRLKDWTEVALQGLFRTSRLTMYPYQIGDRNWVEIDDFNDLLLADLKFARLRPEQLRDKTLLIDLDGTLFIGDQLIPQADSFIRKLEAIGIPYFLFSNNSSYSKASLVDKLAHIGIEVTEERIILSTDGVIHFLNNKRISKIHVVGTARMRDEFTKQGFCLTSEAPDFVVLGYDTELNYDKIKTASYYLNKGIPLLATHCDVNCPTATGPIPDIGSMLAMFEAALQVTPYKIFGKPNAEMVSPLFDQLHLTPDKMVVIGDRLYTDMKLARNVGAHFICVLSGETNRADLQDKKDYPDLIIQSVEKLLEYL